MHTTMDALANSTAAPLTADRAVCMTGDILVDGQAISAYNVSFLRGQMGLVQQEPSLFADSILVSRRSCTW